MENVKHLFDSKCALLWANRVSIASGGDFRVAKRLMHQCIDEARKAKTMITLSMIQTIFTDRSKTIDAQSVGAAPAVLAFLDMVKQSNKEQITVREGRTLYIENTEHRIEPSVIRRFLQTLCDINCMEIVSQRNESYRLVK